MRALTRVRSVTARRQLRWIVWGTALGSCRSPSVRHPLRARAPAGARGGVDGGAARPRAARLRLGHRPLPADGRRGHHQAHARLQRGARGDRRHLRRAPVAGEPRCSSAATRCATRSSRCSPRWWSCCSASPLKNAIQAALDRAYYRDRYDYRRALVGFARDLNSDLDLLRLSERLVHRVMETLVVDRMALLLAPTRAPASSRRSARGLRHAEPPLHRGSDVAARVMRATPSCSTIRCRCGGSRMRELEFWRDWGSTTSSRASRRKARLP
jgi:hypothetical protein